VGIVTPLHILTIKLAAPCDFPEHKRKRVHVGLAIGLKVGAVHCFIEHFRGHIAPCPLPSLVRCHVDLTRLATTFYTLYSLRHLQQTIPSVNVFQTSYRNAMFVVKFNAIMLQPQIWQQPNKFPTHAVSNRNIF